MLLRYLYKLAQNVKSGMSNTTASNAAYSGIPIQNMTATLKVILLPIEHMYMNLLTSIKMTL